MEDVATLRNSVAHAGAEFGVTTDDERERGYYKGHHVFTDLAAFRELINDADAAITGAFAWIKAHPFVTKPSRESREE